MSNMRVQASRAFEALKSLFALAGIAGLVGVFVLPLMGRPVPLMAGLPASFVPIEAAAAEEIDGALPAAVVETPLEREQRAVAESIAKRYRIADAAAAHFVSVAYRAADQHRLDALLILAVMAIESRYNPVAESVMGAKGLMQVIPKYHQEKLYEHGGDQSLLEPEVNILVGAQILREYQRASATWRPRCRCTPARSTSRPRPTRPRCWRESPPRPSEVQARKTGNPSSSSSRSSMLRV
jgi:soluble lytic murein transglycosylase-like protein